MNFEDLWYATNRLEMGGKNSKSVNSETVVVNQSTASPAVDHDSIQYGLHSFVFFCLLVFFIYCLVKKIKKWQKQQREHYAAVRTELAEIRSELPSRK